MASTKENGTAAVAQQLGSVSLNESGGQDNDAQPTAKNGTKTELCSACGKESDTLKKCTACKCVWYCDRDCQKRHYGEHKKECKPIKKALAKRGGVLDLGTEMDLGPLGELPPQEKCPICTRVLPIHTVLQMHKTCCGKTICAGCQLQHQRKNGYRHTCAFCGEPTPKSDEEELARLRKRVELEDGTALLNLALAHGYGDHGLPKDQAKCIELLRESADLGCTINQYELGIFHHDGRMGLEQNKEEAFKYWEKAAEGGHILARHNLGYMKYANGDHVVAMRHCRLSASGGYRHSMDNLMIYFERGLLHHEDLANTLQAMYAARAERESKGRDAYFAYLKKTGEYHAEYEY